jgi:hypothetical protein
LHNEEKKNVRLGQGKRWTEKVGIRKMTICEGYMWNPKKSHSHLGTVLWQQLPHNFFRIMTSDFKCKLIPSALLQSPFVIPKVINK